MGRAALDSAEGTISDRPVVVNPGESCNLLVGGPETWKVQSVDDLSILGTGITLDRARALRTLRNASGVQVGVAVAIKVASDAAPGARALRLRVGDQSVASTGGIVVTARSLPVQTLYFPYLLSSSDQYTGLAIANPSPAPAVVRVTARGEQGDLLYEEEAVVPADLAVAGGAQTAQLAGQIFNLTSTARQSGSVTIVSDNKSVASFFLTGDLKGNYLDGAEAFTRAYRQLYFVDVLQNLSTATELHLQNVKDAAVTVALTLTDGNGTILGSTATRTIPAGGKLGESVSSLFSYSADLQSAHVKAVAPDDAIVGFAYVRQRDTVWGLNAQPIENALASLYSPQLAAGNFGIPFRTRLNVVNVGDSSAAVTITVMSDAGDVLAGPSSAGVLVPGAHLTLDAASFFDFAAATEGSLMITAPAGAKLLGNVVFGDGDPQNGGLEFGAALPLVGPGLSSFMFAQIAQGQGFYTGLAFLAPEGAEIKLEAFDPQGVSVGRGSVSLPAGGRRVSLLDALIPETHGQVRGYVMVTATRPVIGFELFGASDGRFLAAVVPQAVAK
ncbi:MAG: hypothetical protein DMG07_18940 [Acidobacteria bacterium]|nr:MAG: hypothetical protein DMG07_18940 [Acidobacteriota bacterium]